MKAPDEIREKMDEIAIEKDSPIIHICYKKDDEEEMELEIPPLSFRELDLEGEEEDEL